MEQQKRAVHSLYTATVHTSAHLKKFHAEAAALSSTLLSTITGGHKKLKNQLTEFERTESERHDRVMRATGTALPCFPLEVPCFLLVVRCPHS
jgi:hypothetical protein